MKILKVRARRTKAGGATHYSYPPEYDPKKIKVLCYESGGDKAGIIARGSTDEYLIGIVEDADAPQFLASADITEMTRTDAVKDGSKWRPQKEKISDDGRLWSILRKVVKKEALTQDDEDALDPDKPTPGLTKTKTFEKMLEDRGL